MAAYSSRGVGLHARRLGESTTAVPIPEHIRAGEAEFHNPSGQVTKLEGTSHPREESGATHTEVGLTGRVPESAPLSTYECRSVQELTGDRNWASIFEAPAFNTAWSNAPFTPKEGESFWDLSQLEGGKPKVAGQACCSYKVEQQEYARTYAQSLRVVLILVGLADCKPLA